MFELSQYEVDRYAAAAEEQKASNWEKLHRFLAKNNITVGESIEKAFYCQQCTDGICTGKGDHLNNFGNTFSTQSLNEENFQFALDGALSSLRTYARVHIPTKQEVIDDICDLLSSPDRSERGRYSNFNVASVRAKMASWTLEQLQARKDEIERAQALNKKPISELKQMVVDARPQFGFPRLPKSIMVGLSVVTIDRAYLRALPSWELRRYCKIYSQQAVDARLAE
jgi:hypothetical protein